MLNWRTGLSSVVIAGVVVASGAAQAQGTLGEVGAASGISSSMSGGGGGAIAAGQNMRRQINRIDTGRGMGDEGLPGSGGSGGSGGAEGSGGSEGSMSGEGGAGAAPPPRMEPRRWGPRATGQAILNELLNARRMPPIPSPVGRTRTPAGQAALSRRIKGMTAEQRERMVMQKYQTRPKNWLIHYLPEDRHKIRSGIWRYLINRTSRYYYEPWSAAMLKANPNHLVGFRNWQEAMLAGYRPDPVSRPAPAAQIADLASIRRSDTLARYVEFVYAGQVKPDVFNLNYQYIKQVTQIVRSHAHTRPLLGETIDQVILAALGEGTVPRTVGGPPPAPATVMGGEGMSSEGSSGSGGLAGAQGGDRRTEEFQNFSNRAGSMANVPANNP